MSASASTSTSTNTNANTNTYKILGSTKLPLYRELT